MPTQSTTYNSRVTDEALEKRFRDTFTSQGGAELISDLYASGVIVPIVDFTAAAEGSSLREDLQTAWDFSTGHDYVKNTTTTLINTTGFWKVDLTLIAERTASEDSTVIFIDTGLTTKEVWRLTIPGTSHDNVNVTDDKFVVFLRSGDSLKATSPSNNHALNVWYRQIADVNGNLTQPLGFTSS